MVLDRARTRADARCSSSFRAHITVVAVLAQLFIFTLLVLSWLEHSRAIEAHKNNGASNEFSAGVVFTVCAVVFLVEEWSTGADAAALRAKGLDVLCELFIALSDNFAPLSIERCFLNVISALLCAHTCWRFVSAYRIALEWWLVFEAVNSACDGCWALLEVVFGATLPGAVKHLLLMILVSMSALLLYDCCLDARRELVRVGLGMVKRRG